MSGKRLLDAIQLLNVTKSVAAKHLAVRQRQLDVFTRTSSLTKGIENQTDGFILTAKAAAALAKRLNDTLPAQSPPTAAPGNSEPPITTQTNSNNQIKLSSSVSGVVASASTDVLGVSQRQEEFYRPSQEPVAEAAGKPELEVPQHTSDRQTGIDKDINADVYQSPVNLDTAGSGTKPVAGQEDLPEEIMKDIFHSPRVARVLSRQAASEPEFGPRGTREAAARPPGRQSVESDAQRTVEDVVSLDSKIESEVISELKKEKDAYRMVESRVPSSRLGRLWQYGGLATSMAFGAVGERFRRATGVAEDAAGSLLFSAGNMERLVAKLSKMRGAALKLGQMISFQDLKMLPEPIQQVLQRVQDRADYMPAYQRDKALTDNLGPNWRDLFSSFEEIPMAAASIGQVHGAVLKSTGQPVAVKIQYPGVADSIDSDLNNLSILLTASRLLPPGLYLDKTITNARTELGWECDYIREAECGNHFRELLKDDLVFHVPEIIPEASGRNVLTMERLNGIAVTKIQNFTQAQRDWIGTQILRLCLREITEFKYMQTDPNWTNFLYNASTNRLELLDFGASRAYPSGFLDKYIQTLLAASRSDRETCHTLSIDLGYLTGHESRAMVDAHVSSILTLAEPFLNSSPDIYDFQDQTITERVRDLIPVMIKERLAPPPEETYSLHRKLSGAFLLCARLGSRVRCKELFGDAMEKVGASRKGGLEG
ncbi:ABC1 family-domain-containing protein [Aspergillus crustosus]